MPIYATLSVGVNVLTIYSSHSTAESPHDATCFSFSNIRWCKVSTVDSGWQEVCAVYLAYHKWWLTVQNTHTYTNSLPVSALSLCGRPGPALSQPTSLIAAGAAILPCFIYEPSQQRGERGGEREVDRVREGLWD